MATTSPQITLAATTAAQHHDWIAAFSAALDTLGVVKTADTGQVDLSGTTVALPTSSAGNANTYFNSTTPCYQIRKLSASGLPDIFLRFDFGIYGNNNGSSAQAAYSYPAIKVTVGKGTNGAGVITSIQASGVSATFGSHAASSSQQYSGSSSSGSQAPLQVGQQCDFASDGQNYLTIMMGENAPTYENYSILCFGIERSIDANTGNYDNAGLATFCGHSGGNTWHYADLQNNREWVGAGNIPSIAPPFNIAGSGAEILLFPLVGCTTVPKGAPMIGLANYSANIVAPVPFPATMYGTTHTYKACPRSMSSADPYATGTKLALRFE